MHDVAGEIARAEGCAETISANVLKSKYSEKKFLVPNGSPTHDRYPGRLWVRLPLGAQKNFSGYLFRGPHGV